MIHWQACRETNLMLCRILLHDAKKDSQKGGTKDQRH